MFDVLTSELLDLTASVQGTPLGQVRVPALVLQQLLLLRTARGRATELDRASPAAARAVVPPRRGRRPAPLEHGRTVVVLEGGAVQVAAAGAAPAPRRLADGRRAAWRRLGEAARPAVAGALDLLASNDLLVDGPARAKRSRRRAPSPPRTGSSRPRQLERLRVVVGRGGRQRAGDGEHVARLLRADGIGEVRRLGGTRAVSISRSSSLPRRGGAASGWNRHALEHGDPLARRPPVRRPASSPSGHSSFPARSCCHECLLLRLAAHLEYGADLPRIEASPGRRSCAPRGSTRSPPGSPPTSRSCWLGGSDTRLPGVLHVLETDPRSRSSAHRVLRVPRCPACSPAERLAPPLPWHEARGGMIDVAASPAPARRLRLHGDRPLGRGVPGGHVRSAALPGGLRGRGGAGLLGVTARPPVRDRRLRTHAAPRRRRRRSARRSSATRRRTFRSTGFVIATARELGELAVAPERFALFSERQHATAGFPFRRFTRDAPSPGSRAASFPAGGPAYLPAELVYLGRATLGGHKPIAYSTSSGLACGEHEDAAVSVGSSSCSSATHS